MVDTLNINQTSVFDHQNTTFNLFTFKKLLINNNNNNNNNERQKSKDDTTVDSPPQFLTTRRKRSINAIPKTVDNNNNDHQADDVETLDILEQMYFDSHVTPDDETPFKKCKINAIDQLCTKEAKSNTASHGKFTISTKQKTTITTKHNPFLKKDEGWIKSNHRKGIRVIPRKGLKMPVELDEGDHRLFNLDYVFGLDTEEDGIVRHSPSKIELRS